MQSFEYRLLMSFFFQCKIKRPRIYSSGPLAFECFFSKRLLFFIHRLFRILYCGRRRWWRGAAHPALKIAYAFAQSLHHFGNAAAAKKNQYNSQNNKPMENAEFTNKKPPR